MSSPGHSAVEPSSRLSESHEARAEAAERTSGSDYVSDKPLNSQSEVNFVEGGVRGWLAVLGGSLVLMTTFGNMQSFGVFQDYYTRIYYFPDETPSNISWIGSLQLSLQFIVGVISGKLFDKGHFHVLMLSGSLLVLFSSYMLSLAKPHQFYQALLSQGFGFGIGSGLVFLPSLGLTSHYFKRRRAVAMGIMISSGSLGGVIYSILLNKILPRKDLGFHWAVRFISFIDTFLLIVANLIMRPRPLPGSSAPVDTKKIFSDSAYWITAFGLFLGFLGVFIPYFYLQLFANIQGVDRNFLTWAIPILNAGAMVGRLMPNFLADAYGPLNILIPCGFISGALMWALLGIKSIAGVTVFALIYGFVSGAFLSLASPAIASFSTSPSMNDIGIRLGIACLFMGLALLGGNPIAGALLSAPRYLWWRPLTFGSVVMIVGSLLMVYARQAVVKRRGSQKV